MTEEQTETLIKAIKDYNEIQMWSTACYIAFIIVFIFLILYGIYKLQKMKKYRKEWLATLSNDQIKAIEESKKYNL